MHRITKFSLNMDERYYTPDLYEVLLAKISKASKRSVATVPRPASAMVLVRGGSYDRGYPDNPKKTRYEVSVDGFTIKNQHVTVGDFKLFADSTRYRATSEVIGGAFIYTNKGGGFQKGSSWRLPGFQQTDDDPVVCVSWFDCIAYCNWLSIEHGKKPVYMVDGSADFLKWKPGWNSKPDSRVVCIWDADGYRLPTEAEWEFAARGGVKSSNTAYAGSGKADLVSWYSWNSEGKTHEVGQKMPNELGLYDMIGNAMQWCWDWYGAYYYEQSPESNPRGPETGKGRCVRGGSWDGPEVFLDVSYRHDRDTPVPTACVNNVGFRLACAP
jgi:formylglycine-generating enzyme required for sulfatase activity